MLSLLAQAGQNHAQAHIALLKVGHGGHDLLVSGVAAGLLQLHCQIRQFLGMGGIVAHHVLHQSHQLFHGGMLALLAAGAALVAALVGMGVLGAMVMEMIMGVGMRMIVGMGMGMLVGVSNTVVGVLMGMGMLVVMGMTADMIVMQMHGWFSFAFFLYYSPRQALCQNIYFSPNIPHRGLPIHDENAIIGKQTVHRKKVWLLSAEHDHNHHHEHDHAHDHEHDHAWLHAHGIAHSHGHVHENQKAVLNRLARAIGHLEKVKRMVEEGYDCSEVLVQLAAVRSALDNTGKVILKDHMRHCMVDAVAAGDEDAIEDLCAAIDKFMK